MKTQCIAALIGFLLVGHAPGKTIPNHAIADLVLGQPDFVTGTVGSPVSSESLRNPSSIVIDPVSRKVFVADMSNNRILRYPSVASLANGGSAEAVFGQARFSSGSGGSGDQGLSTPRGLFLDRKGRLWIADSNNHRVLMFEVAIYRDSQPFADRVFGQPDFATNSSGLTSSKMAFPYFVFVDSADRLWVSDAGNNRVLRFDSISSKASGAAANGVLGQASFGTNTSGLSASKFNVPLGVVLTASGSLFVADWANNRVLRFDNAATLVNGSGASRVLGQPDFATNSANVNANSMGQPWGLWHTPDNSLWVCEANGRRALRFDNAATLPNGATASGVVGQPDFVTNIAMTTDRRFSTLNSQPFVDATGSLWVPDTNNNRVLRFPPDVTKPLLAVTSKVPKSTSSKTLTVKGTASDTYGISKVTYRVNSGSTKTATGTTTWQFKASLKAGNNKITINSVDSVGNKSVSKVLKIERR